jgi:hypothetical protein
MMIPSHSNPLHYLDFTEILLIKMPPTFALGASHSIPDSTMVITPSVK